MNCDDGFALAPMARPQLTANETGVILQRDVMSYSTIFWDEEDDPDGNVQHIAEHDLTIEDVEAVLAAPVSTGSSQSTGLPAAWGHVPDGRFIIVVFEQIDKDTIRVVTAYEVPEPRKPRTRKTERK